MSYISNINKAWKVVLFGKVVRRSQYGLSESATEDGVPYLKMSNIRDGKVIVEGADRLKVDDKTFEDYALKDGDIVFNRTNSLDLVGKTGVFRGDQKVVFASYLVRFQLHDNQADSRFIAAWFASAGAAHRLRCLATPGVSQSNINPTTLRLSMHVPLPPLPEQRKIADILTTWDEALTALDDLIEAQERRKRALMQQLLSRAATGPTHARRRMGEVLERVTRRNTIASDNVLTISAQGGLVNQKEYFSRSVAGADLSNYYLLHRGEFAYNRSSSNGYPYGAIKRLDQFAAGIVSTLYLCFRIKDGAEVSTDFLCHYFEAGRLNAGLRSIAKEGARAHGLLNVTADEFFDLDILLPSLPAQQQIAAILDTADQQLTLLRTQRTALDQQKRGLMQRLLTGKLRVKS